MITYAENVYSKIESKQDDCRPYGQQPDGYGRKIATPYLVRFDGRGPWRRVYCCIFSNAGTVYAVVNGEWVCFKCDENLRINGEWPANECATAGK